MYTRILFDIFRIRSFSEPIKLTEDIVNALNELADSNDLMGSEKERIRKMSKSMRVYINSDFDKRIFNTPGKLFPESDNNPFDRIKH
jgi:hypothetical protein